jgi:predicted RNA-binding protein with PUA-like domain
MRYWLMKSEPEAYSISDLQREGETIWDGVRNYQARSFLREMKGGDRAFFYHSNCKPPGIVGLMTVIEENMTDPSQFDPQSPYYDPHSPRDNPRWQTVKLRFTAEFTHIIPLDTLKLIFSSDELGVVRRGNRLSVMPVAEAIAQRILALGTTDEE